MLKAKVTETAANTFTEALVQTPVSAAYFQAMRVHKIVFDLDSPNIVEDANTIVGTQLTGRAKTGLVDMADADIIAKHQQLRRWISSAAGGESDNFNAAGKLWATWDFGEQGILVTDAQLHLGVQGTSNTQALSSRVVVYYTLETLQPDEYVAALTVLGAQL